MTHRILIVGGGFGGLVTAANLAKARLGNAQITVINPVPWLTYYGVLYRLILRPSRIAQACLPISLILPPSVRVVLDEALSVDPKGKVVRGAKDSYGYDTLVLAIGSVPTFFNIPGMEKNALVMKSIKDAAGLNKKVSECLVAMKTASPEQGKKLGNFIIVGAGPTGIEVAGEMHSLLQELGKKHGIPASELSIHIIEAADRILPALEESASQKVSMRLNAIGIHVHTSTAVASADKGKISLTDGLSMEAHTIVWTAGVRAHPLLEGISGMELDKRKRVMVDEQLRAKGHADIVAIGDCASTPYSGMAQTAVTDGVFAANVIAAALKNQKPPTYHPIAPEYAIPAGHNWAAVKFKFLRAYGLLGYFMRRAADIHVYMMILPWKHVLPAYLGMIPLEKYGIARKDLTGE